MANNGITICVVTSAHDFNDDRIFHKQIKSFLEAGYRIKYVSKQANVTFSHPNFEHIPVDFSGGKLQRLLGISRLYKLVVGIDTDVYHMHDPELILLARKLKKRGAKVVFDVHEDYKSSILATSLPFKSILARIWDRIEKEISTKLDLIVCADSYIKNRYKNPNKIVLGNYPPLSFGPKELLAKPNKFTIVYAGGVNRARGIERLMYATDQLNDDFELVLVGPCNDEQLLEMIKARNYISYLGKLDWTEVSRCISSASIGVALYEPSINFTYCTGEGIVKLFEYLGCGLPIVTSNFPNLKAFIDQNEVGITVDPMNINEINAAIEAYMIDSKLLNGHSEKGHKLVRTKYNWDLAKNELLAAYEKVFDK